MSNYQKGVRFEREVMKLMVERGYACTRAAGSHSAWDVIAYRPDKPPLLIQCKVVQTIAHRDRLIKVFKETTVPSEFYSQALYIKVGRGKDNLSETII